MLNPLELGMRIGAPILLAAALSMGCRGDLPPGDPNLVLEIGISPTPPGVGPARLIISLKDTLGAPVEGAEVRVEGNMSHAGMVPVMDSAQEQGGGVYTVPAFSFTMAGDWILTVTAELEDGRWTTLQKATDVASAPPGFKDPGGSAAPEGGDGPLDEGAAGAGQGQGSRGGHR